ncbi:MAG: hypothetical protein BGO11_16355 [Solirubrobacterales bacterium 70-9]|nr:MAG: hypothetical protein BGO11_16355 [Solirubrobacterales bacterium 70-9]
MICVIAAALAGTATAAGTAGQRDTSFGKGGKVTVGFPSESAGSSGPQYELPFEFTPGNQKMALAPGGKVVVAGAQKVARFLEDGKLDPTFGENGVVRVARPTGGVFVLSGTAVDSLGRVILVGLTRPLPTNSTPDPVISSATVMRFTAAGKPDPTFGTDGVLITDFGLGDPAAPGGTYTGPSVGLRSVTVDSQNRIIVSGGYVTELSKCASSVNSRGFVARLTQSGSLDPSFGAGGIRALDTIASLGRIAPFSGGYLTAGTGGPFCTAAEGPAQLLTAFTGDGNLNSSFASFSFRTLKNVTPIAMTVTPTNKILLLGQQQHETVYHKVKKVVENKKGEKKKVTRRVGKRIEYQVVVRLLPSGAFDPGFSRIGSAKYVDPKNGSFSDLTGNAGDRTYLVGNFGKRVSPSPNNHILRRTFVLGCLNPKGTYNRAFGRRGKVRTGFGGPSSALATQVLVDGKGRILVGGSVVTPELPSGGGFAIARYLPGS